MCIIGATTLKCSTHLFSMFLKQNSVAPAHKHPINKAQAKYKNNK